MLDIKSKLFIPYYAQDQERYAWLRAYIKGGNLRDANETFTPEFPSSTQDFRERYENTIGAYQRIRLTENIEVIIKELNSLLTFLEIASSRALCFDKWITLPDGGKSMFSVCRDPSIDTYFEDRVLKVIKKAIVDLERLGPDQSTVAPVKNQKPKS